MPKDDVFGKIEWTGSEWTTSVAMPDFQNLGERLDLGEEDRQVLSAGRFDLTIDTSEEKRKPPTEAQRTAWKSILERKEEMWQDILDALVTEYELQRPMRAAYWKTIRGDKGMDRILPANIDRSVMSQLVAPMRFGVHAPDREKGLVDVYVSLLATWWSESINVYIREGQVLEVTALGAMHNRKMADMDALASPVFGMLRRRIASKDAWMGSVRLEGFREFGAISVDRSSWDDSYTRAEEMMSDLPWNVARGSSSLWVYSKPGVAPTEKQHAAFEVFRKDPEAPAALLSELFKQYQETLRPRREAFVKRGDSSAERPASLSKAENLSGAARLIGAMFERLLDTAPAHKLPARQRRAIVEKNIPLLQNAGQLRNMTELSAINIFPEEGSEPAPIGFVFSGPWIGDAGLGVRWRNGKIEEIGTKDVAQPEATAI
jgi:hypothetical protein